ncbi:MAG: 4Fe-4S binding protein [Bacillota bacterium]
MKVRNDIQPKIEPGSSVGNKTGFWRSQKPIFDHATCTGCSLCSKLCPDSCIYMKMDKLNKLKAFPDYDYCKGCGLCAAECPFGAIKMEQE